MSVEYSRADRQGVAVIALKGRLDSANAGELEKGLGDLFAQPGQKAVVDMEKLDYISSAGLRVMLMLAKRARQTGGRLMLSALAAPVREVFEISGFLKILETTPSTDAALAAIG
jgi:anti-anti-sigma factor